MKTRAIAVALILVTILAVIGCAQQTPTPTPTPTQTPTPTSSPTPTSTPSPSPTPPPTVQPIIWKAVTFLPRNMNSIKNIYPISERAKQRSNGQLVIQYLGGPEVIPGMQQPEAVRKGIVQMSIVPVSYYDG